MEWSGFNRSTAIILTAVTAASPVAARTTAGNLASESGAPDFFRPPPNMFQATYGTQAAPGSSDRATTTDTFNLRYDHAFDIPSGWIVANPNAQRLLRSRIDAAWILASPTPFWKSPFGLSVETEFLAFSGRSMRKLRHNVTY